MDDNCETLGEKLRELRMNLGDSVRDFADRIGKSPGYVSQIEVRGEIPTPELLCHIADICDVDPELLLQLAKSDQITRTTAAIENKHESVLKLYRKGKR